MSIVDFGAFIDVGVEKDALLHRSKLNGVPFEALSRWDIVLVQIEKIDRVKRKVNVTLLRHQP